MLALRCLLGLLFLTWLIQGDFLDNCLSRQFNLNVVLLEDENVDWSLRYVEDAVYSAIEKNKALNEAAGLTYAINPNFTGFNTTLYRRRGCQSSSCEGVQILKSLYETDSAGCAMLGPSCTYATFQLVDQEVGFILTIPIISAGSFGLSCDNKPNLTRLLPPARKISNFFRHFWNVTGNDVKKTKWETAYVYKQEEYSEECFWYINALEASSFNFAKEVNRKMLRSLPEIRNSLGDPKRHSNIFILCGTPDDIREIKETSPSIHPDIVFILIDVYNENYYLNETAEPYMKDVLVFSLPNTRNYSGVDWTSNQSMINDYVAGYHDGVLLFGEVIRQQLIQKKAGGSSVTPHFTNPFRNIEFDGLGGHYVLDEYGDRDVNFSLMYVSNVALKYKILFEFQSATNTVVLVDSSPSLSWARSMLPDDKPEKKDNEAQNIIVIVLGISVVIVTGIALIFYRQNRKERQKQTRWSHIQPELIAQLYDKKHSMISLRIDEEQRDSGVYVRKAHYDKKPVILKELRNTDGNFSDDQRIELNSLLRIDYYNLTKFYGTVKFEYGVFGVFEFCERGSLRYILDDKISYPEETFMDLEFKISVIYDIAKGMSYLHSSNIGVHGRLKSTNCVLDNRMVVKITDFGCHTILSPSKDLWTAPEHLREQGISQKGDVYSFAIVAHEILLRERPFYMETNLDVAEKLKRVQYPNGPLYFRPDLNFETGNEREVELNVLIKNCWDEDPEKRPDFKKIEGSVAKIFSNVHNHANESYMDTLIRRLQMYSRNLEHLVEERTALYKAERDRADRLNFMLLPGPVVRSLKETGHVEPELFDEVTIYFSDIVGFTTLCHYSTPMEVVDMLNDIYKNFDSILDHHDVYKVETIGDAYMVASGLPRRNGNRHAVDIAHMALDILAFMGTFRLRHLPSLPLWIRIGVHSGPCAAGVVGNKMPRYCLFGDTVNTAARMESTGQPLRIHVSQSTINILQRTDCKFEYEKRGETYLKGKGKEMTYWLTGVTGQKYDLPTPPTEENFQRLQQDLAQMIESGLEKGGATRRGKTLSTRQRKRDRRSSQGSQGLPEYFHLADPSTYL
ncbi:guanylyl cyclase C [Sardina pilchardus]|uniref:guanylyl cyclase C n=1 Tax=Sardina pilchardus TaxID=27697 RepID=UPI002E152B64